MSTSSLLTARVQVVLSPEEREAFRAEAKRRGESLSAWMRAAAHERLARSRRDRPIQTVAELEAFFERCHARVEPGIEREPDWDEYKRIIEEGKTKGLPDV